MGHLHADFDGDGRCRIVRSDGREVAAFQTVYSRAFNSQYPPPLSADDSVLYVGTWERGLYCYRASDGELLWRHGPGKVRNIFPVDGGVVTEMADRGLYRRAQASGELEQMVKMSGIEIARRLSPARLFAGPYRNRYFVFNLPTLKRIAVVSKSEVNPESCLSFIIRDVSEIDGQLVLRGFEEYPNGNSSLEGQRDFVRRVRPDVA